MPNQEMVDTHTMTFTAGAAVAAFLRVKINSSGEAIACAAALDDCIGYATERGGVSGQPMTVRLINAPTHTGIAKKSFAIGAVLYGTSDAKVTDTKPATGRRVGYALTAAGAEGDQVMILPIDGEINS